MAPPLQIGRYVLHGEIASGGMAAVHYGRLVGTSGFSKTVAIKRLHRALAQTPSFRKMILDEARLAARVRHPNVVPPLDVLAEGGELLLVMEYVHGESLSRLLRAAWAKDERVPLPVAAAILVNVLHGLHAAHEATDEAGKPLDIVHRDISPQNIIVGADGIARVIDFGIAKAVTSEEMTTAGTIKGKVPYLSPEQLEGDPATRRTDMYAAAVVFWEMLANRRLFEGADDGEVLRNILMMEVKPPSAYNPLVAGDVDDIVLRALSRTPSDRFASAREMALELENALHLATATVVGAWTERLAAETLARRAEEIRAVEAASSSEAAVSASPRSQRPPPPLPAAATRPPPPLPAAATRPPPPPPSRPAPSPSPPPPSIPAPPVRGAPRISIPHLPPPSSDRGASPAPTVALPAPTVALPAPPPPSARTAPPPAPTVALPAPPPPSARTAQLPPMRPPQASRPPALEPRTVIYEPPPMPEPAFVEGVRAISRDAPPPSSAPRPPAAGVLRQPAVEIRNVAWLAAEEPKPRGSAFKRFLRYLAAFLALGLIVAWMFAPAIARAWLVTGAAARGIVITIDRVDVSRRAIRLNDVHAESAELPGTTLRAGTVVIGLRWLVPDQITIDDAEIELDGPYSTLATRLAQFRAKHGAAMTEPLSGLRTIEITSGHVEWKNVIGTGTSALLENITLDVTKNPIRKFGDDYHFAAPLFRMTLAGAPAGPWQLDVDRQGILVRSVLRFDTAPTYPSSVTRTAGDDGSVSLTLSIPPTALVDLHLPAALLGPMATDRTRLEGHGEVSVVAVSETTTHQADAAPRAPRDGGARDAAARDGGAGDGGGASVLGPRAPAVLSRSVSGHLLISVIGLALFPSGPPADVSLDLPLSGDAALPLPLLGTLAIAGTDPNGGSGKAAASAALKGTLDASGPAVKIALTGQTGPIPCARASAVPGRAAPTPAKAEPTNAVAVDIAVSLDDLPGARVSLQPQSTCPPKLR